MLLERFKGKVCTVFTVPVNRDFRTENPKVYPGQIYNYFLGVIDEIDENGFILTQAKSGLSSYFYHAGVVMVAEEEVLDEEEVIIEEEEKVIKKEPENKVPDSFDPAKMEELLDSLD